MILAGILCLVLILDIVRDLKRMGKGECVIHLIYNKLFLISILVISMILNVIITY